MIMMARVGGDTTQEKIGESFSPACSFRSSSLSVSTTVAMLMMVMVMMMMMSSGQSVYLASDDPTPFPISITSFVSRAKQPMVIIMMVRMITKMVIIIRS